MPSNPVRFVGGSELPLQPPPRLGEHTESILGDLGYSQSEIVELRAEGVIQ